MRETLSFQRGSHVIFLFFIVTIGWAGIPGIASSAGVSSFHLEGGIVSNGGSLRSPRYTLYETDIDWVKRGRLKSAHFLLANIFSERKQPETGTEEPTAVQVGTILHDQTTTQKANERASGGGGSGGRKTTQLDESSTTHAESDADASQAGEVFLVAAGNIDGYYRRGAKQYADERTVFASPHHSEPLALVTAGPVSSPMQEDAVTSLVFQSEKQETLPQVPQRIVRLHDQYAKDRAVLRVREIAFVPRKMSFRTAPRVSTLLRPQKTMFSLPQEAGNPFLLQKALIHDRLIVTSAVLALSCLLLAFFGSAGRSIGLSFSTKGASTAELVQVRSRLWLLFPAALIARMLRMALRLLFLVALASGLLWMMASKAHAESTVPQTMNYAGRLLSADGTPVTTSHHLRFSEWTSADRVTEDTLENGQLNSGSTTFVGWQEVHSVTPDSEGYFSVELGSQSPLHPLDSLSLAQLNSLFLQIEVKESVAADTAYELLDPESEKDTLDRSPIRSVPFSFNADMVDQRSVGTGSGSIPVLGEGGKLPLEYMIGGVTQDAFTVDVDDSSGSPSLHFGETLGKVLSYSVFEGAFRFNDDVEVAGMLSGTSLHAEGTLSASGALSVQGDVSAKGDATVGGELTVAGNASFGSTVSFGGVTYNFPSADGTASGKVLATDGAGHLFWKDDAVGATEAVQVASAPILIRKDVDETVSDSTILHDDSRLSFPVQAGETWTYSFHIIGNSHNVADFTFAVSAPDGSTCAYSVSALKENQASAHTACGERSEKMDGEGRSAPYLVEGTVVAGGMDGRITLQWSQQRSSGRGSTVRAGSWLRAEKVE